MAHIVVYLQRTPLGIHPGSAVGLCLARDIASERGATVTALCMGDAGAFDRGTIVAASRFGADSVVCCGPQGFEHIRQRLHPVHVFAPWTFDGIAVGASAAMDGKPTLRWITESRPAWIYADAVTGLVAGLRPWHNFEAELEAEYESDVDEVTLPPWLERWRSVTGEVTVPVFQTGGGQPIVYGSAGRIDDALHETLQRLGAQPYTGEALNMRTGTLLWFDAGAGVLPEAFAHRDPHHRLLVLPGPEGACDESWSKADMVLRGFWPEVVSQLSEEPWWGQK